MDRLTLWEQFKETIAGIAWHVFLWASDLTQDDYINQIYEQEHKYREGMKNEK